MHPVPAVDGGARLEGLEVAERRLVAADLLGGDEAVDLDAERSPCGLEQVVVAVGEDAELPAVPLERRERRGGVRKGLDRAPALDEPLLVGGRELDARPAGPARAAPSRRIAL